MTVIPNHLTAGGAVLHVGDVLDVLRSDINGYPHALGYGDPLIPDASIDAVVTDPPYGIAFMGKKWDQPGAYGSTRKNGQPAVHAREAGRDRAEVNDAGAMDAGRYDLSPTALQTFQQWCEAWAAECYRVLKPGGHIVAFGGARTWHRLTCGIEDAGFEIRDSIAWLYGQGFPKSVDIARVIDLHLGVEPEVIGEANYSAPVSQFSGILDHGRERIVPKITAPVSDEAKQWAGWGSALKPAMEPIAVGRKPLAEGSLPANILEHGVGGINIDATRVAGDVPVVTQGVTGDPSSYSVPKELRQFVPNEAGRHTPNVVLDHLAAAEVDRQAPSTGAAAPASGPTLRQGGAGTVAYGARKGMDRPPAFHGADPSGASQFFPVFDTEPPLHGDGYPFRYEPKAAAWQRPKVGGVQHPTVKPVPLMRWLVRLTCPNGGRILEPFAGSGTTGEAALVEGCEVVMIEREADYVPLIEKRIRRDLQPTMFGELGDWEGEAS